MGTPTTSDDLVTARAQLVDHGVVERAESVAPHVLASWRRSLDGGVSPAGVESTFFDDLDTDSRLVACATPVIERLALQLVDAPVCIALADSRARVLARRAGSPSFARTADRACFAEGFGYAEGSVGTNGVGTVLEHGRSVQIVGAEHFAESLHTFACAGAPIRNPFTHRIEGVLDIGCFADHSTPILHSMVRAAAQQVEHLLVSERSTAQQALFDAYARVEARSRGAVVAVGSRLSIATEAAEALLDPRDLAVVQRHVRSRTASSDSIDDRVDLPSGLSVRLRGRRIGVGADVAGMVCVVDRAASDEPAAVRPRGVVRAEAGTPALRIAESGVPALRLAADVVAAAWDVDVAVRVVGERGAGRTTLLRAEHARRSSGAEVVVRTASCVEADPDAVGDLLARPDVGLVVLQDLDRLGATTAARLADVLGHAPRTCLLGATWTADADSGPAHAVLLQHFAASAIVPPLRHRGVDLTTLTSTLLAELAPHRDARLSPDAERLAAACRWPGNVAELRDALARALRARPVGTIEADDLSASCRSTPRRHLRLVDGAERDVTVGRDGGPGGT